MVFLGLLLIRSPSNNIINDSAEGVLVSPCLIYHTRGFLPITSTIYQNSRNVCFWGDTINAATKLMCKYKHNTIQRPGSRWSNSGNMWEILSFNCHIYYHCMTCKHNMSRDVTIQHFWIHDSIQIQFENSKLSNPINNFFLLNKASAMIWFACK